MTVGRQGSLGRQTQFRQFPIPLKRAAGSRVFLVPPVEEGNTAGEEGRKPARRLLLIFNTSSKVAFVPGSIRL